MAGPLSVAMVTFAALESYAAQTKRPANVLLGISARRVEFFVLMTVARSCSPVFLAAKAETGPVATDKFRKQDSARLRREESSLIVGPRQKT
jgi:hypothetical protein